MDSFTANLEAMGFLTNAVLCWVLITNSYNCLQRSAQHLLGDKREIWQEGEKQGLGMLFPLKAKLVLEQLITKFSRHSPSSWAAKVTHTSPRRNKRKNY